VPSPQILKALTTSLTGVQSCAIVTRLTNEREGSLSVMGLRIPVFGRFKKGF